VCLAVVVVGENVIVVVVGVVLIFVLFGIAGEIEYSAFGVDTLIFVTYSHNYP
jgi:hypothetical protein